MITKDDLMKHRGLARLIEDSAFTVQGKAVIPSALLLQWYRDLGQRLEALIEPETVAAPKVVPVDTPVGDDIGDPL